MKTILKQLILTSIAAVLLQSVAPAQESRASITGLVLDSTGAPVPKAAVVARNIATNVTSSTTTNTTGNYSIQYLIPGDYEISAEAPGGETGRDWAGPAEPGRDAEQSSRA